jgi:hypothetical protein
MSGTDWNTLINAAIGKGYRVRFDEDYSGWIVITPHAPRRPSQELGSYKDEQAAWRGAAHLAHCDH